MEIEIEQALKNCDSDFQRIFVRRLREEMARQAYSGLALSAAAKKRGHTLSQSTVSRLMAGKQDPSLGIVHALADTLGVPNWFLLTERSQVEERVVRAPSLPPNVVKMKPPYPSILQEPKSTYKRKGKKAR